MAERDDLLDRTPSSRLLDLATVLFALFTVACHVTVLVGGNARDLTAALALGLPALVGFVWWRRRRDAPRAPRETAAAPAAPALPRATPATPAPTDIGPLRRGLCMVLGGIALWIHGGGAPYGTFFYLITPALALACIWALRRSDNRDPTPRGLPFELALWALAIAALIFTEVANNPDSDESFYINMAISVADHPDAALLDTDWLHGDGKPFRPVYYKLHSIEIVSGLISLWTGIETIVIAHVWVLGVAALLCTLSIGRLSMLLDPRRGLWIALVWVALLVFDGSTHRGYGNFAFTRLFQGKSMMVTGMLPVLIYHGLRFAQRPTAARFGLLAAGQMGALGLSATAIWWAPVVSATAVGCGLTARLSSIRTLALGLASCAYPLAAGLYVLHHLGGGGGGGAGGSGGHDFSSGPHHILWKVVGGAPTYWLYVGAGALAFGLARAPVARRVAAGFALIGFGFALNPLLSEFLAVHVTGRNTYWRAMWLLPLPLMVAVSLTSILPPPGARTREARVVALVAGLATLLLLVPKHSTFHVDTGTLMNGPGPKASPSRMLAQVLVDKLEPGQRALAEPNISRWLPTFNHHPVPLLVKPRYLKATKKERNLRRRMQRCVTLRRPARCNEEWFEEGLDHYRIAAVAFDLRMHHVRELREQLERRGFRRVHRLGRWLFYTREPPPDSP
ncbi:MAG: DUF6077 domain-containing protein [Myxococcales bacterium]